MKAMVKIAGALLLLQGAMDAFVDNSEFKLTQSQKLQVKRFKNKDTPPQSPDSKTQLGPIMVQTTEGPVIGESSRVESTANE
jgi:hypothetical protein